MLTARLVRALTLPYVRLHPGRALVTVLGVALGVAAHLGIVDVNRSIVASFEGGLRTIAGESELEVSAAPGALTEGDVGRVASVAGVAAAAGMIETVLPLTDAPGESLHLLGIDFLGSPVWQAQFPREAIEIGDELEFLSQPDSVVLTRAYAAKHNLDTGAAIAVTMPDGPRPLHVRGLLDDVAASRLFGGALAVMDLPAAAMQLGRDGAVDRILVTVEPGTTAAVVRERLVTAMGPGVEVAAPEARGEQAEKLIGSLRAMLATAGFLGLIVGGFVVFHTVTLATAQRRRQFALADAVGISPRALRRLSLVETFVLASIGAVLGVAGGRAIGLVVGPLAGAAASEIWMPVDVSAHGPTVAQIAIGVGLAFVAAAAASMLAVRAVFRATTIEALRVSAIGARDEHVGAAAIVAGLLAVALGGVLAFVPAGIEATALIPLLYVAEMGPLVGGAFIAPVLVTAAGWTVLRATRRTRAVSLRLAALHLPRSAVRGGAVVGTIGAAMGLACALAIFIVSFQAAWLAWIEQHFAADLFVGGGDRVRMLSGPPMSKTVVDSVRDVPGVESVEPFRVLRVHLGEREVFLQGIAVRERLKHGGLPMVHGSLEEAAAALEAGTAALVSDGLAYKLGIEVGDAIDLPAPDGAHRVRVAGTYVDFLGSLDRGAVVVDAAVLTRFWVDESANLLRVWLADGADAPAVRRRVLQRLGGGRGYFVLTGSDFVDAIRGVLRKLFFATWMLLAVAALIGVIGIATTQVATVLDRAPDHATLHTIGIPRHAIARGLLVECGILGILGGLLGVAIGVLLAGQLTTWTLRLLTGWRIGLQIPVGVLVGAVAVSALISALAGWIPARVTMRQRLAVRGIE